MTQANYIAIAARTFRIEREAVDATFAKLDQAAFAAACDLLLHCAGRVVVTGMGKSGHIARKIASTLSSTGTPALFMHPAEAAHGDMGMLKSGDVMLMLSRSGESEELTAILPTIKAKAIPVVAITAEPDSRLARAAHEMSGALLLISVSEEACPLDLAPTASTTASLVLGDALAMALLEARNFSAQDFAKLHPAGALGRRLTLRVRDLMVVGDAIPTVAPSTELTNVMMEMSQKRLGATCVVDEHQKLLGIITDGDIRRFLQSNPSFNAAKIHASDLMTPNPRTIGELELATEAMHQMEVRSPHVMHLVIVSGDGTLRGMIHLHEIVRAGIN